MPVQLAELEELARGIRAHLFICELPRPVAGALGANPGLVYLGKNEFWKIAKKHSAIRREEFQTLPYILRDGSFYMHAERPNCATAFCFGVENDKPYTCAIKATEAGGEVWVQSFYRTNIGEVERKKAKGQHIYGPK